MDICYLDGIDENVDDNYQIDPELRVDFIKDLQDDCKTFVQSIKTIQNFERDDEPASEDSGIKATSKPNDDLVIPDLFEPLDLSPEYSINNKKINHMASVLDAKDNDHMDNFEEDIYVKIEEINDMRETLEMNGVKVDDIPKNLENLPESHIHKWYKRIKIRHDRLTYANVSSTIILGAFETLERVFSGNLKLFGTRPSMVGFTDKHVRNRLPTLKKIVSKSISSRVDAYGMTDFAVATIDLLPAMIHYATEKRNDDGTRRNEKVEAFQNLSRQDYRDD